MTPELKKMREEVARKVDDAYFNAELINGISPQQAEDAARIGFDEAHAILWPVIGEMIDRLNEIYWNNRKSWSGEHALLEMTSVKKKLGIEE